MVRTLVHFLGLTGVSLNIRVSCSTDVLSAFRNWLKMSGEERVFCEME